MEHDLERDIVATAMIYMSEQHGVIFCKDDICLEAPTAMISESLVSNLMRLASFSVNITTGGAQSERGNRTYLPGEDILMALAFDHAIEMSSRKDDETGKFVVDFLELQASVLEIEKVKGRIEIDHDMVSRVVSAAFSRLRSDPSSPSKDMGA